MRETERWNSPDRPVPHISSISCLPKILLFFVTITQNVYGFSSLWGSYLQETVMNHWGCYPIWFLEVPFFVFFLNPKNAYMLHIRFEESPQPINFLLLTPGWLFLIVAVLLIHPGREQSHQRSAKILLLYLTVFLRLMVGTKSKNNGEEQTNKRWLIRTSER